MNLHDRLKRTLTRALEDLEDGADSKATIRETRKKLLELERWSQAVPPAVPAKPELA